MDTETAIVRETQSLHSDMQTLVYENYNKFISATDTIRKMKTDFKQMEQDMNLLKTKMESINTFSQNITGTLQGTRTQMSKLSEKHSLLSRLQFLSSLPAKLKTLLEDENYTEAVHEYMHAEKVFKQYGHQPSFQGIKQDCESIIKNLTEKLKEDFKSSGKTAKSITETGELLLKLGEQPKDLADGMLQSSSQRLHEQIVMLQDQKERDMIEFVDMGIEGFLTDLTIVVTSYHDMFLREILEEERDDFHDNCTRQLNVFLNKNVDEYLSLIQDRVDSETGYGGDTEIMLRGLDRLHRRLLAMKNMYQGVEINRNAMDIIISAAHQLCKVHQKNLKDHFSDNLSSLRLSLVSVKSDTNSLNLNELVSNLYVSTIEKAKGVLQDLLVFIKTEWSFNIKAEFKGSLCIDGIRENLLVEYLRHISKLMGSFADLNISSSPPNLLLVLSKTCLELDQNGVHMLMSLVDDLYDIESENSATLTHETEISAQMKETAQLLLDSYVRLQGNNISQMLRKSVETRDWLNCLEPRSVRAVMKRVVEELSIIEKIVESFYDSTGGNGTRTSASSDSSRKTHFSAITPKQQFRTTWSNYTPSQLESTYASNIHKLFSEKVEIFTSVEFTKVSIITGMIKIGLKVSLTVHSSSNDPFYFRLCWSVLG